MSKEPAQVKVQVGEYGSTTALLYEAPKKARTGITLILGHGAGANQLSAFMLAFAQGLSSRGLDIVTFNFLYSEARRGAPDPKPKLEACYSAVIAAARKHRKLKENRVAIGGKSMGGRIASQVAANGEEDLLGLVFLGYPLHPPGRPDKLRDAHLPDVKAPMFFIQGERDTFGSPSELRAVFKRLRIAAELLEIPTGDHSLKVLKSVGMSQPDVYEMVMNEITKWLNSI